MLDVRDLKKGFGSGRRRLEVLKGIDLEIKSGELVALMGPSGCGESTLLNIIGGLLEADSGSISLSEFNYGTKPPSRVVDVRRRGVGWIFQDFHLIDRLSSLDNVIFALELSGVPTEQAEQQARDALEKVGLGDRMEFIPDQLSGGQRQRVAIARAIARARADGRRSRASAHSSSAPRVVGLVYFPPVLCPSLDGCILQNWTPF